jgi:hypothetical protein
MCELINPNLLPFLYDLIFFSRWDKYSPIGRQIDGTPFVAFKVPLQEVSHTFFDSKIDCSS